MISETAPWDAIKRDLLYTAAERETLDRLTHITWMGITMPLGGDIALWSTLDGIARQIAAFNQDVGMIYWFAMTDGVPDITSAVVDRRNALAFGVR